VALQREVTAVARTALREEGGRATTHAPAVGLAPAVDLTIYTDLAAVEAQWRRFEAIADCTAFQAFDWLAAWHRHVGQRRNVTPVIVIGRSTDEMLFLLPLAIERGHGARRLAWLGHDLCDYNAPLLAPDFSRRIPPGYFRAIWEQVQDRLQADPSLRFDWIELEKMPEMIGGQPNPFAHLDVTLNPSGAYRMRLEGTWDAFYSAKRSAATRRRDRTKRKRLAESGEVRFVTSADEAEAARTLETLIRQKRKAFASMGVADLFARPGYHEFFADLASNPRARHLVHISRLDVGDVTAATNFALTFRGSYYHVLASHDDGELSRFGPGAAHLRDLMQYAIEHGLDCFDFTIGDEPYKREWCDDRLKVYDHVRAMTWRGRAAAVVSVIARRVKRFIKQTPSVWRTFVQARAALGGRSATPSEDAPAKGDHPAEHPAAVAESTALACVMGDMDLLRPLALAGIPCAVVTRPGVPSLYSRYARHAIAWNDFSSNVEEIVDALMRFGTAQPQPPVLFYEEDAQLLLVSRHRERLSRAFRFVAADAALVEDLVDKARFQALAERLDLPVPPLRRFHPAGAAPRDLGLKFPLIIKPLTRLETWNDALGLRKALFADTPEALAALWPQLTALGLELLAQELIPGAEDRIESYHVYVDRQGAIAGEFTGRKIRTYPIAYGHTTALVITDVADVREQGRAIIRKLALKGVAKLDFKRGPDGRLHLLEINPRFNLWHHAAAIAGVNLPALVYADLVGSPRPATAPVRAGVKWCRAWKDLPAARASGVSLSAWLAFVARCEAKSTVSWDDPVPLVRATLHRLVAGHFKSKTAPERTSESGHSS
jgi:D-aspartate ligase